MVCDFGRRPYTTDAKLSADGPAFRIRWYPAHPDAAALPFPSKFVSLDMADDPALMPDGPGEVFYPSSNPRWTPRYMRPDAGKRPFNRAEVLPYAHGLTPCAPPAWFSEGQPADTGLPPQIYNADFFPTCCLDRVVPEARFLWGAEAVTVDIGPPVGGVDCAHATPLPFPFSGAVVAPPTAAWFVMPAVPSVLLTHRHFISGDDPAAILYSGFGDACVFVNFFGTPIGGTNSTSNGASFHLYFNLSSATGGNFAFEAFQ